MPPSRFLRGGLAALGSLIGAHLSHAFDVTGTTWASGDIVMHLQLGAPASPLSDGATSWGTVAEATLADWNAQIARSRFAVIRDSSATRSQGNRTNNVFFSS